MSHYDIETSLNSFGTPNQFLDGFIGFSEDRSTSYHYDKDVYAMIGNCKISMRVQAITSKSKIRLLDCSIHYHFNGGYRCSEDQVKDCGRFILHRIKKDIKRTLAA